MATVHQRHAYYSYQYTDLPLPFLLLLLQNQNAHHQKKMKELHELAQNRYYPLDFTLDEVTDFESAFPA